ncbi:zinc-binding alcohol dehydrogenase family protein [Rhodovarius crocodyli]|uniref:Zinc-binding alcohol dehydrogenase family protein n=1 Tax=Rhodovarius crocodyli TaxID=1979269 RepID=A0A437MGC5_9PROT|nr:zinc-binding dehydrogenase [Rhodovarius crocodyli]RVT96689.1 zinc-binding alcohol dehydrogenase family protein [Rhodovarius crocodyli]
MKAIRLTRFGEPEALEPVDMPLPVPGAGEALVRVRASGVNFADTLMRRDRYAVTPPLPAILGNEVAGTIEALGPGVEGLEPGARVAAPIFATAAGLGGYAEYAVMPADYLVPLPAALSFEQAVAVMVQGLAALHLVRRAPPAGKLVLVNAAAGGVGSLLVQLAKHAGARLVAAAAGGERKLDFARSMGADAGVDYTRPGWTEELVAALGGHRPDIIYESAGGDVTRDSLQLLAPLGQIVIYGALNIQDFALGVPELLGLIFRNQSVTGFAVVPLLDAAALKADLGTLFGLVADGRLTVTIGGRFPLEQAAEAHRRMERRDTIGKLVLLP